MPMTLDTTRREVLRHFLATLAYRTQKALRGAPEGFESFSAGSGTRTPEQLVRHMRGVIGYARTCFVGGVYRAEPQESFEGEVEAFHAIVADLSAHLAAGTPLRDLGLEQLLQGPLSDAMTHAGQLALLRRLAGSPVESENFLFAHVSADNLGSRQPSPAAPASPWMGRVVHAAWRLSSWLNRHRGTGG